MKSLLALLAVLSLASCAQTRVSDTYVATTTFAPSAIYIRPFLARPGAVINDQGNITDASTPLRQAQAPIEFANILQVELAKIAPALVLRPDEEPAKGWLVEGEIDLLDGGKAPARAVLGILGAGKSNIRIHVKVSDIVTHNVLYAFDISGGSGLTGHRGNTGASGLGLARTFDMRNAATRIRYELQPDLERLGYRER